MELGFDLTEWEKTEAIEMGEYETLALGGHVVKIVDASLYTSEFSGNTSLKVCVDIDDSDKQANFFKKQYDENPSADKKWSNGATRYLSLKTESLAYTKGFISALEKSNSGFKFNTTKGWDQLKGLKCAGVFGLEEYEKQDGTVGTATKLVQFRSIDKLNEIKIPKVKLLNGTAVDYESYTRQGSQVQNNISNEDVVQISPEDLPF